MNPIAIRQSKEEIKKFVKDNPKYKGCSGYAKIGDLYILWSKEKANKVDIDRSISSADLALFLGKIAIMLMEETKKLKMEIKKLKSEKLRKRKPKIAKETERESIRQIVREELAELEVKKK